MKNEVRFDLRISRGEDGSLSSSLSLSSREDWEEIQSWPSGGLVQVPHALFREMIHREAYTMSVSALSTGVSLEALTEEHVSDLVRAHLLQKIEDLAEEAVREALLKIKENK